MQKKITTFLTAGALSIALLLSLMSCEFLEGFKRKPAQNTNTNVVNDDIDDDNDDGANDDNGDDSNVVEPDLSDFVKVNGGVFRELLQIQVSL